VPISLNLPGPLPGFPITIPVDPVVTPEIVAALMQQFHSACETGDMLAANELLVDISIAINAFALHRFTIVYNRTIQKDAAFAPVAHSGEDC
jgi:hypothetical protein